MHAGLLLLPAPCTGCVYGVSAMNAHLTVNTRKLCSHSPQSQQNLGCICTKRCSFKPSSAVQLNDNVIKVAVLSWGKEGAGCSENRPPLSAGSVPWQGFLF